MNRNVSVKKTQYHPPITAISGIDGFVGHRIKMNRENYIKKFPIEDYISFIEERQHTAWDWTRAEQHGKWIESAILSALQSGDKELMQKVDEILARLIASQEEEGYVGATAKSVRTPEKPLRGMDAYELYFVLHAFLTCYEEAGNREALASAVKLGNYFEKYIGPGKAEFWPGDLTYPDNIKQVLTGHSAIAGHSVHYSWEGTLLIDPMLRLYTMTGDEKYLNWSKWVVSNIDKWSGWNAFSNLDKVADGTLGVNELQPYVHAHTFQMNFLGLLRLYEITGDKSLLREVEGAWNDIAARQMYITGGVSVAEHYEKGYIKPLTGNVVETCATMSWMQLTQYLLELTGDVKYGDAIEKLLFNHVFAAQTSDGDGIRYHTPPNGFKPDGYYHGPDCCTASGHRLISLLPYFIYGQNQNDIYLNQYVDSDAELNIEKNKVNIQIETRYPESDHIKIKILLQRPVKFNLHLRMPDWCSSPSVSVKGGILNNVTPGTYLNLDRLWQNEDVIELVLPQEIRWIKREHHQKYIISRLPGGEIIYDGIPESVPPYALLRGPVVYALDTFWNEFLTGTEAGDFEDWIRIDKDLPPEEVPEPGDNLLGPAYKIEILRNHAREAAVMLPFANIGNWYKQGSDKLDQNSRQYAFAIWLDASGESGTEKGAGRNEFVYCNPNAQVLMRDTHIIPNFDDGKFYAVGTLYWGANDAEGNAGFRLFVSDNLRDWQPGPWIMKQSEIPAEAWYRERFWAPEIRKIGGKWYFTYNCGGTEVIDMNRFCAHHGSGISVADKITGPYKILARKPLAPWPSNDLTLFEDEDGKVYAFFNDGFFNMEKYPLSRHSIYVAEINLEKGELAEEPRKLLTQQEGFESVGIEGSHVVKVDSVYYLFYSGFFEGYAVGYATAKNIYGPYARAENNPLFGARHDGGLVRNGEVIRGTGHPYKEIGHNQVFKGPDGRIWTSCHAYLKNGDEKYGSHLIIDPLEFRDGRIITNAPTYTPQRVKIDPEMLRHFPGLTR